MRRAPPIDLSRFVTYRMSVLSGRWAVATERFYRERFGLSLREWRVLGVMPRQGSIGPVEIVRLTALDKAGVSRALAALERKGYVRRGGNADDARKVAATLTARGHALLRRLVPAALARQASLTAALSAAELDAFFALLEKLERRADALTAGERST
jgi:DNA-binding MarR family transcriptional regulator